MKRCRVSLRNFNKKNDTVMFENKNKLPKLDRYLIFVTIKIICKLSTHSG